MSPSAFVHPLSRPRARPVITGHVSPATSAESSTCVDVEQHVSEPARREGALTRCFLLRKTRVVAGTTRALPRQHARASDGAHVRNPSVVVHARDRR
jgi:hypothetical protein